MMIYSKDKMINALARDLRQLGWLYRKGKKHGLLIAPNGRRVTIPSTPSDFRSYQNFSRNIRLACAERIKHELTSVRKVDEYCKKRTKNEK